MKIEISFKSLYSNYHLYNYFFREQSQHTLADLIYFAKVDEHSVLDAIDSFAWQNDYDIDAIEEMFYEDSVEEIAKKIGIETNEEEEEEEDDEEEE